MTIRLKTVISRFLFPKTDSGDSILITEPRSNEEMDSVYRLLAENLPYDNFVSRPRTIAELLNSDGLGRTILCAWKGANLVGAIFFGAAEKEAATPLGLGAHNDAQAITERVLMIHEIATHPAWRRQRIATRLIQATNAWAQQRGADVSPAVPMSDESRHLMQQLGYIIAPPTSILILQIPNGQTYGFPTDNNTTYAIQLLTKRKKAHVRASVRTP